MDPGVNGVQVTLAAEVQAHIQNPPIPSAGFFDIETDITARVPIGVFPGTIQVGAMLDAIPRANVSATITSGDPIPAITNDAVAEYVHQKYLDGTIKDHYAQNGVSFGGFTADAWLDVYDDLSKPNHHITVVPAGPGQITVLIPVHLKLSNCSAPAPSPMGVVANIAITSPLTSSPGLVTAPIATAGTVAIAGFAAAPANDPEIGSYDSEGSNYSLAVSFFPALATALQAQLTTRAQAMVAAVGDISVVVPTDAQIEDFIAGQAWKAITGRGDIALWTPTPPPGGGVAVTDVKPLALADAMAFCLNNPAGDTSVIANFIPAARSCAIAIDGAKVLQIIDQQIHRPESEGGFGPSFPPKTFNNIDGHDAKLTSLTISLIPGSIHIEGDVTVVNAIADSIDVDASFSADAGLQWDDNPDGTQMIKPFVIGDPDVDLSLLAWIVSFLLGFITLGLVGGIVALVVMAVAEGVAEKIGGVIIRDDVTGQIEGVGAWPQTLEGIGTVTARFENPVGIDATGILFGDAYTVVATYASVTDALANSHGPYTVPEGAEVTFDGGARKPRTDYSWDFGDGNSAAGATVSHRYADDGLYVAKLTTVVHESGGVTTRHFAAVLVENVPPTVDAGPPITIDEGAVTAFAATFTDPGWPDTHRAFFDFGDDASPVEAPVTETHTEPLGKGSATATHAYCDNGTYTVTVRILDDDGGVGVATKQVVVRNVVPAVDAGPDLFAYHCTPITLVARFTDPGWCDTHVGTWDFGDCSAVMPATVRERHEPPEGCGIVAATHRYAQCGHYLAVCTVTDDDGGVGRDSLVVRVVDVVNGGFEGGFHTHALGDVGNGWMPYTAAPAGNEGAVFAADEYIVHDDGRRGQRAQRVSGVGKFRAGITQRVGTNAGWDYQVSAWYHQHAGASGAARLGVDPAGGSDPAAVTVVWMTGHDASRWSLLAVRCTATTRDVAIFVEYDGDGSPDQAAWFDDVELIPYPCPLGAAPPCTPPKRRETCVDWKDEQRPRVIGPSFTKNGFTFTSIAKDPLRIVLWGPPAGAGKLAIPRAGVRVSLPFSADRVVAHVWSGAQQPIRMEGFSSSNASLGVVTSSGSPSTAAPEMLEFRKAGIATLQVTGGEEGDLVDLCIYAADQQGT
ncbi:MAG TPA: PKD domain-containing protein, partial [Gemmatimonadaceae bacterium]|jgi:hypothetical protein